MKPFFLTPRVYDALPPARRGNLVLLLNLVLALGRRTGECIAGQSYLADRCGLSVPTVRRCERVLRELGFLECDHHRERNRRALRPTERLVALLTGRDARCEPASATRESAITPQRSVDNRVHGTRAHSELSEKNRSHGARQGDERPGELAALRKALVTRSGIWPSAHGQALDLVDRIVARKGSERAAGWLRWLLGHNARAFPDARHRGRVTFGALRKAAGVERQAPRGANGTPSLFGDLVGLVLAGTRA